MVNNKIKIFLDTGSIKEIKAFHKKKIIKGFTSNPTLLKKYNSNNITLFAKKVSFLTKKPLSIEVTEFKHIDILDQAIEFSKISKNIFIKIPFYDRSGKSLIKVINELHINNINLNITAVFTLKQIRQLSKILTNKCPSIVSIFAGRISDTLVSPKKIFIQAKRILPNSSEVLWASTREIFNIVDAINSRADIITISSDYLAKLKYKNYDLDKFSKLTCKQFFQDCKKLKY